MKKILFVLMLLTISIVSFSQKQNEKFYQDYFNRFIEGKTEIVLDDKTRVDIVTDTFAIEVDFAHKWAESIGQSLHYAEKLHKTAGILLIVDGDNDERYVKILMSLAIKYNVTVWVIDVNDYSWRKVITKTLYYY